MTYTDWAGPFSANATKRLLWTGAALSTSRTTVGRNFACAPDWEVARWDGLAESLHNRLARAHEGLNFRVERAGTGELPRFELKAQRTVDKRNAPIGAVP